MTTKKFILALLLFQLISGMTAAGGTERIAELFLDKDAISQAKKSQAVFDDELESMRSLLNQKKLHQTLHTRFLEAVTPGDRMQAYDKAIRQLEKNGISMDNIQQMMKPLAKVNRIAAAGSISGTLRVAGELTNGVVQAYDEFGFNAGWGSADWQTGLYTIEGLRPGLYYVRTSTSEIDEFYNNIPGDNFNNFRQVLDGGFLVEVKAGEDTPNIDFDLEASLKISGMIYKPDGVTPVNLIGKNFNVYLTPADEDIRIWGSRSNSSNGEYSVSVPFRGQAKLGVMLEGYQTEFWQNKPDWDSADIIDVSVGDADNIDFVLDTLIAPVDTGAVDTGAVNAGGVIAGSVTTPGGLLPVLFGLVAAFNTADTSFAGFGIAAIFTGGEYTITGLETGSYWLYADDFLGNLAGYVNLVGEYYKNTRFPALATPVAVTVGDTTPNINFELALGGGIGGRITDDTGSPLDSILVLAFNAGLLDLEPTAPLTSFIFDNLHQIQLDICMTDENGNYMLGGLPSGNFYVRSISLLGKHAYTVFDEYHGDVQGLLQIADAMPVEVTAPLNTAGVDMVLDRCGYITGHVYDEDGTTPLPDVSVMAIVDSSAMPVWMASDTTDSNGVYVIPMLHTGDYKLLALPSDPWAPPYYVSEFWDGARFIDFSQSIGVTAPNITDNIDFTLDHGGFIHGIIELHPGYRAGSDTLNGFPVVAYDATTGEVAGVSTVNWAGGYRIGQLPQGEYYVASVPARHGFAATYHGGGAVYGDPLNQLVPVLKSDSARADITIEPGFGSISGSIRRADTEESMMGMVFALDQTGHAVSFCLSGLDVENWDQLENVGDYILYGLRAGDYYVRTWMAFGLFHMVLVDGVDLSFDLDNLDLGLGDALPGLGDGLGLGKSNCFCDCFIPQDQVANGNPIHPCDDHSPYRISIVRNTYFGWYAGYYSTKKAGGVRGDYGEFSPLVGLNGYKWYSKLAKLKAELIRVTEDISKSHVPSARTARTTGIDFNLHNMMDLLVSGVTREGYRLPSEFVLEQNYPNPFNPETVIQYSLPQDSRIELTVFNAVGQKIKQLVSGRQSVGQYKVVWDGRDNKGISVPSGIYIYRIRADHFSATKKLALIR